MSNYKRTINGANLDIYDILVAYGVTCPARQHAIKKLLVAGNRGAKGVVQDLEEASQALSRAVQFAKRPIHPHCITPIRATNG